MTEVYVSVGLDDPHSRSCIFKPPLFLSRRVRVVEGGMGSSFFPKEGRSS